MWSVSGSMNTIRGIGRLGRDGMAHTNDVILGIMLENTGNYRKDGDNGVHGI